MITAKAIGLEALARDLAQQTRVVKTAAVARTHDVARNMVAEMRARVPEDSGGLRDSIRAEPNKDGTVTVCAGGTPATTRVTENGEVDQAVLVEHGTIHMPGSPFFWPVVEAFRERHGAEVTQAADDAAGES